MKKEGNVLIRVSGDEKEAFERAAEISGLSFSAWARQLLRDATVSKLQTVGETPKFLTPKTKSN